MRKITRVPSLPARPPDSHKGRFGHVLAIGGALGMSGAISLAGRAASRAGAGLVTLAAPARSQPIVAGLVPEALTIPLPERPDGRIDPAPAFEQLGKHPGTWTVLAAGCGWGLEPGDKRFAADSVSLIERLAVLIGGPTVIDADGLNLLAATGRLEKAPWPKLVITPHPGELARLLRCSAADIQSDRLAAARKAIDRLNAPVLVLKGAGTIVTDGERYYVNTTGNPGMATGGTGDVLTGVLAGLLAQGMEPFDAAVLAVYVHGRAGDLAARVRGQVSLVAGDLPNFLGPAFRRAGKKRKHPSPF